MPDTYRVAVIGRTLKGNYGHGIDKVWLDIPQTKIVAVADDNKRGLEAEAGRLKVAAKDSYTDYRLMLDKTKPDIVAVCQRWIDMHAAMVIDAAQRGVKGIYLEKPMCQTLEQADAMIAACEKHNVKLAIAHQTRYSPILKVVRDLLESGRIGSVLEYRARGKEDRRGGGEDLWVLGTHVLNLANHLAGDPTWCFARVIEGGKPITKKDLRDGAEGIGPLAGDAVHAMYRMADGSTCYFNSNRNAGGNPSRFGLTIYGSKGVIDLHTGHLPAAHVLDDPSWTPGRTGKSWTPITSAGVGKPEPLKDGGLHAGNVLAVRDLIDAIEKDRLPESNTYEARTATEMIVSCFESQRVGGPVSLPLKTRVNPLTLL